MLGLKLVDACIEVNTPNPAKFLESIRSEFTRRYLPTVTSNECSRVSAVIYWLSGGEFKVLSANYSEKGPDTYVVQGGFPEAYVNESPAFFLVQVFARSLAKEGYVMLTDSISIEARGKTVLLLGFPHTGKSTMASIAISLGYTVYSTENTVVKPEERRIRVVAGTRVLVYDPRVRELYGVTLESATRTKHGYEVIDLDEVAPPPSSQPVDEIYVIYTSFNSYGASLVPIKGRKVEKTLWYFATSLLKGMDYYYPQPLDMPLTGPVANTIHQFIKTIRENYVDRFYEAFGSPLEVLKAITSQRLPSKPLA